MPKNHIITHQYISPGLKARAKALRREMTPAEIRLWHQFRANRLRRFHFSQDQIIDV